jgi:predicted DNA-binding protein YlxM (UPF0122 family)
MNEKDFKYTYKIPVCTQQPWKQLISIDKRDEILRIIRRESIEAYGYSMDECPKRKVCFTKECLGRPLPWLSKTAKPYLEKLKLTHTIINDELYINNCTKCPIVKVCSSTCLQVNDFIRRNEEPEPKLIYQKTLEQYKNSIIDDNESSGNIASLKIPWDSIPERKANVVKKYLFQRKDFLTIAKELDLNNQARAKYEFYSALTTLSEVAIMRKFIETKGHELEDGQLSLLKSIYFDRKTLTEVAKERKISKQAVQQLLSRIINKYKIKWAIFVKKHKNKVIYNIPEILK